MGTYWRIVNLDKREQIDPGKLGDSRKLHHFARSGKTRGVLFWLLGSDWHGDHVVFISDAGGERPGQPHWDDLTLSDEFADVTERYAAEYARDDADDPE